MAMIASAGSSGEYSLIPEGTYPAICYGLVDNGEQYNEKYDKTARKITILWEADGVTIEVDGKELNRSVSKTYTMSLHEKSALRKDLRAWRGREFTDEELAGFDLVNILGKACLIQIVHVENNGKTFANIAAIMALPRGIKPGPQTNETLYFDAEDDPLEDIGKLPRWLQDRVRASNTYKARTTGDYAEIDPGADDEEDTLPF